MRLCGDSVFVVCVVFVLALRINKADEAADSDARIPHVFLVSNAADVWAAHW